MAPTNNNNNNETFANETMRLLPRNDSFLLLWDDWKTPPQLHEDEFLSWFQDEKKGLLLTVVNAMSSVRWHGHLQSAVQHWNHPAGIVDLGHVQFVHDPLQLTLVHKEVEVVLANRENATIVEEEEEEGPQQQQPDCIPEWGVLKVCTAPTGLAGGVLTYNYVNPNDVNTIVASVVHMDEEYLEDQRREDLEELQHLFCHALGHGLGLPHRRRYQRAKSSCMSIVATTTRPDAVDKKHLLQLYGSLDS